LALAAGNTRAAADQLGALVSRGHDGYDVRERLALAALRLHDRTGAEAHLRRAIQLAPTRLEPHVLLAELLGELGREQEKTAEEEAALRLEPQNAGLAKRVVLESARAGRLGTVLELGPIALFIDPADPDLHAAYARALAGQGKTREAVAAFERALLFSPVDPI